MIKFGLKFILMHLLSYLFVFIKQMLTRIAFINIEALFSCNHIFDVIFITET